MFGGAMVMLMLVIMLITDLVAVDDGDTVDFLSAPLALICLFLPLHCLCASFRSHRRTE